MELRHLRYFVAVAEDLSFSRAAERLYMAQPPLSYQIRQLEEEVGTPLLSRTSRRVEMTEAGRAFLTRARKVLADVDEAVGYARKVGRGEAGWLGIGFIGNATIDLLPPIVRTFRERHPGVELSLQEMMSAEQKEALREGRIHIGFVRRFEDPQIAIETLRHEPLVAALPAAHRLAARETVPISELGDEQLVSFPPGIRPSCGDYIQLAFSAAGITPRIAQVARDLNGVLTLVAAGVGAGVVPRSVENLGYSYGGVVFRPLITKAGAPPTIELALAYRRGEESPAICRFIEVVREAIAK